MSTLEIRVFGALTLERDGEPLDRFPSRQVKGLLSYLLLSRETLHPREHLAGLFWGDLDDRRARHCLNTALWRLHRILAPPDADHDPYLRVDAHSIGFNTSSEFRLDLADFEHYCSRAEQAGHASPDLQASLFRQAVKLHSGGLLTDCYEDWCLIERERVQRLYLRALGFLMSYHGERGEFDVAIEYAHRILSIDPLREEVHRDLIDLHLAARQPAEALRRYEICAEVLERELGIGPMTETQDRLRRIVAATGTASTRAIALGRFGRHSTSPPPVAADDDLEALLVRLDTASVAFDRAYDELKAAMAAVRQAAELTCNRDDAPDAGQVEARNDSRQSRPPAG